MDNAVPDYVQKLDDFNVHVYLDIMSEFEKKKSRCAVINTLEIYDEDPDSSIVDALITSFEDNAVKSHIDNIVPEGYRFFIYGQVDRIPYVIFTKYRINFSTDF